ncbi:helix-turn-helix domain-containing protein [Streptomyces coffeae]|uniref:Helix-turn-helix domain-containing protein n=1 Tax=Streptomyces coffeae TaxID=621382 RepID=A0ABS1NQ00_9ACTN|nr:helix-turn-helix domain-containing protein [Streptomyces coffeae]
MKKPHNTVEPNKLRPPLLTARASNPAHGPPPETAYPSPPAAASSADDPEAGPNAPDPPDSGAHKPQHHPHQLLNTAEQAAVLLQVPASWLRKKAAADQIPYTKVGRHLRFSTDDLNAIIRSGARGHRHHT